LGKFSTVLYATLHYATLRYATLRYATLRYATLRYATLLYSTLRALLYSTLLYSNACVVQCIGSFLHDVMQLTQNSILKYLFYLTTPSVCINLGGLFRLISSAFSVTRLTESKVPEAKSIIPPVGRATSPTTPFPTPLKNPPNPSCRAPTNILE
jgi:hypothetical protein